MAERRKSSFFSFFFGTPRRFLASGIVIAGILLLAANRPDLIELAVGNLIGALLSAIQPHMRPIMTIGAVVLGFMVLLGLLRPKPDKKKKGD